MLDRLDAHFRKQLDAVNLRSYRSQVLAGNIANADTPHYKAQDFDFRQSMLTAQGKSDPYEMKATSPKHFRAADALEGTIQLPALMFRSNRQPNIDGNTVDADQEISQFSENALRYQASLLFLQRRVQGLQNALQSQ